MAESVSARRGWDEAVTAWTGEDLERRCRMSGLGCARVADVIIHVNEHTPSAHMSSFRLRDCILQTFVPEAFNLHCHPSSW